MPDPIRDAFGRLIADPAELSLEGRVDLVRGLAGHLQADSRLDVAWLGDRLNWWLAGRIRGGIEHALGLVPPRGSKTTAQALVRRERRDKLMLRLSTVCGSDAAALRAIQGGECPTAARSLLAELRAAGMPASRAAFVRARRRVAHQGR